MRWLCVSFLLLPACSGFLAPAKKAHWPQKKVEKPDCHVVWEDVVTPHCKTSYEQVRLQRIKVSACIFTILIAGVCGGVQGPVQDRVQHLLRDRVPEAMQDGVRGAVRDHR